MSQGLTAQNSESKVLSIKTSLTFQSLLASSKQNKIEQIFFFMNLSSAVAPILERDQTFVTR